MCAPSLFSQQYSGGTQPSAGPGSTFRVSSAAFGDRALWDSNGVITPAGSKSMTVSISAGMITDFNTIMVSVAP
jgi:hypothetical protein